MVSAGFSKKKDKSEDAAVVASQQAALDEAKKTDDKALERERQLSNKLQCKVDMLTAMVAMKDALLKTSEERFSALKWEVLANYHCDQNNFNAMTDQLRDIVHGWQGEVYDGTQTIATLVVLRKSALDAELAKAPKNGESLGAAFFADALCAVLPEFRRDYLERVVEGFGSDTIDPADFFQSCEEAFADALRKHSKAYGRLGRAASKLLNKKGADLTPESSRQITPPALPPRPTPVVQQVQNTPSQQNTPVEQQQQQQQEQQPPVLSVDGPEPVAPLPPSSLNASPKPAQADTKNTPPSDIDLQQQLQQQQALLLQQAAALQAMQQLQQQQPQQQQQQEEAAPTKKKKPIFSWRKKK